MLSNTNISRLHKTEYFKLGIASTISIVGVHRFNYTKSEYVVNHDLVNAHTSCPNAILLTDLKSLDASGRTFNEVCTECSSCPHNCVNKIDKYYNDLNDYKLYNPVKGQTNKNELFNKIDGRLPKYAVKQFLLFWSLNPNKYGILKNIDLNDVAAELGCNIKTVQKNNDLLVKHNYIMLSHGISNSHVNIAIRDYDKLHIENRHGGAGGYINISKETLDKLLSIKNVNALRAAIRALIDSNLTKSLVSVKSYTYKQVSNWLPAHINYKRIIDQTMKECESIFQINRVNNEFYLVLSDCNSYTLKKRKVACAKYFNYILSKEYKNIINQINHFNIEKTSNDLSELSRQYGKETVIHSLNEIKELFKSSSEGPIRNLGALVHDICKYRLGLSTKTA